jgi:hypothetical protein
VILAVAAAGLVRLPAARRGPSALALAAAAAGVRAAATVWHFWEHLDERDPDLPHAPLGLSEAVVLVGILVVSVQARRGVRHRVAGHA